MSEVPLYRAYHQWWTGFFWLSLSRGRGVELIVTSGETRVGGGLFRAFGAGLVDTGLTAVLWCFGALY